MGRSPSSTPSASARRRAARLVCFGFDGLEMNDHARSMIDAGCGAVIIFARNIATPAQVASLTAAMKRRAAPRPASRDARISRPQVPRLYGMYKERGLLNSFQELLDDLFAPLFEVSIDPNSHPKLHLMLQQVVG